MSDDITLDKVTDILATLQDYLELYMQDGRPKENAISRLAESVFWITYGGFEDD